MTTPELAAIADLADDDGVVIGVAADHRDALAAALEARGLPSDREFVAALKSQVVAALSTEASLVLVDHEVGLPRVYDDGSLAPATALAVPWEAQGYGQLHEVEVTTLIDGFGPAEARDLGAHAMKLLLPFRLDRARQALRQADVARHAIDRCRSVGVPLILEPVVAPDPEDPLEPWALGDLVIHGAERLAGLQPHLLKLQYPGSPQRCEQLSAACGRVPWVLLGGGESADVLVEQVEHACAAGARGFIVGRSLWQSALSSEPDLARRSLDQHGVPLLASLAATARAAAVVAA